MREPAATTPEGSSLRQRREALGWTQAAVAEAAGVPTPYVSKAEHGRSPGRAASRIDRALAAEEARRQALAEEEAAIDRRRALAAAVPDSAAWRDLQDAFADRAMALLSDGQGEACDALLDFLPAERARQLLDDWLDAETDSLPRNADA